MVRLFVRTLTRNNGTEPKRFLFPFLLVFRTLSSCDQDTDFFEQVTEPVWPGVRFFRQMACKTGVRSNLRRVMGIVMRLGIRQQTRTGSGDDLDSEKSESWEVSAPTKHSDSETKRKCRAEQEARGGAEGFAQMQNAPGVA